MNFHHFDHLDRFAPGLKVGSPVKKGQLAGYCGKTGTAYAHCHYEIMRRKPDRWLQYTYGMTREQVLALYIDPTKYVTSTLPMRWNKLGYDFMSPIVSADGRHGFHPGKDLNLGNGDDELGQPVYFTCDGVVEYVGNKNTDGGAGNNLWWSEQSVEPTPQPVEPRPEDVVFGKQLAGKIFLSVEERGEAWYVRPDGRRVFMGKNGDEMLKFVRENAGGITKANLNRIPKA